MQKRKHDEAENEGDDQAHDEVRLWEDGFKDRYYESKFDVSPDNLAFRWVCLIAEVNHIMANLS